MTISKNMIAQTPKPPYYAVVFTSERTPGDKGYNNMAAHIEKIVHNVPGFLGMESAREQLGITVSYWKDLKSIENWKNNPEHRKAKQRGKDEWYQTYKLRICKVESETGFTKGQ
ncbi:antibiotic biosynthesis monooxygenase family protein [Bacteroidota bacterium]